MRCWLVQRGRRAAGLVTVVLALVSASSWIATAPMARAATEPPPDPGLVCPVVEGFGGAYEEVAYYSGREGMVLIFGSSARFSTLSMAECSYSEPDDENSPVEWATIEVYWASPVTIEQDRIRPCLLSDTERDGVGVVTSGDGHAAYATYAVTAEQPVDTAPFAAAARALLDQVSPLTSTCDGVAAPAASTTELPAYLAGAFVPEILAVDASTDPAPEPTASATEETATPTQEGSTTTSTAPPSTESASGFLRALGVVAAIASLVLLAVTFVLVRRETRIRPARDVARVGVIAAVAVAGTVLLADGTSPAAIVVALLLGFALGAWQGSKLAVRAVGETWTARRTGWSVLAFAVGIAITQVAGRLDRVAGITLGLATMFLSAALAAGVIVGRRGRLVEARRAAGVVTLLLFVIASASMPNGRTSRADDGDPDTVLADERSGAQSTLVGLVDWSNVGIRGGLFVDEGKPAVTASVPAAFDTAPEPVTSVTTWSRDVGAGPVTYSVEETYTFGLRADGVCCTVDYAGAGTRLDPSGTATTYEAVGRLDDIQSVAIEGSPTSSLGRDLLGVPFGEVRSFRPPGSGDQPATADPASCGRSVAETRASYDLDETGGAGAITTYRVDGVDREPPNDFAQLTMTTGCDVAGFTPADAIAVAPPAPPVDDPVRGVGCPVVQEVLGALVPASSLVGVDTATTARAFLEPNAAACADFVTLGQGGPGETRHELMYQFAQPTDRAFGEDSSQVDEIYWTDLPLASDIPPEATCAVDESGLPVAPADPITGCQQVNRYELDGVRVFVWTDWQTSDGPNVLVFVTAPWGSYSYRCHHCTPNDPAIGTFLTAVNSLATTSAEQIAQVGATRPEAGVDGVVAEPADDPAAEPGSVDATTPDVTADVIPDDATPAPPASSNSTSSDLSEPLAVAALLSLGGAAAMLGVTLGELSGWRASDAAGAGLVDTEGGGSAAGDALGYLNTLNSFEEAQGDYVELGYDPGVAAALAAAQVLGGNAAGDAAPFGGIADNRLDQLSEAFLPEGVRSALVPSEVVKNNIRTALEAYDALTNSMGDSWYRGELDLSAFDEFGAAIDARPGADPFAGYSQAMGLYFDELYTDGGVGLVQDLVNLYLGPSDVPGLGEDPMRVTRDDFVEALYESAAEFRDDVAAGAHHVVLQGIDDVFGITAELVTDPVEAIGGFVDDLANIAEHGVGDGYWTDVAQQVDVTLRDVPVVKDIYAGYSELFSGVVSHADRAEDLISGAAQAGFAAEMAEGAAALGAEAADLVLGGDNAVRAFDYVRSWF